jgi:biotin synthase-related radical SAM superfamily protein
MKAFQHTKIDAFALTGGVYPDNTEMVNKYIQIIQGIRKKIPEIPIGVETIILEKDELIALRESGMDEMKINLQIPDEILFEKICPDFDYNHIISMLEFAVKIFGKGNVFSNIIFGLGESDDCVISAVENIAKIGVVPTLRKIRIGKKNGDKLLHVLPATIPEINTSRILKLAYEHKRILQKYHLTTTNVHTMCHRCGCCDIVPFQDL